MRFASISRVIAREEISCGYLSDRIRVSIGFGEATLHHAVRVLRGGRAARLEYIARVLVTHFVTRLMSLTNVTSRVKEREREREKICPFAAVAQHRRQL